MVPIARPGKIVCVGLNYRDHAEEQGVALPESPLFFAKYTTSLIGPGDPIVIPSGVCPGVSINRRFIEPIFSSSPCFTLSVGNCVLARWP